MLVRFCDIFRSRKRSKEFTVSWTPCTDEQSSFLLFSTYPSLYYTYYEILIKVV